MSDLPSLTADQLIKFLQKKGFELHRISGSHHIFLHKESEKKVVIPYHKKDVPKGLLLAVIKQAGISKEELKSRK